MNGKIISKPLNREEALEILEEIEENVAICCAITMDPEEVETLIYRLKEILEKINAPNVTLVGQSWGGFLASYLSAHNPNLVDQLVLTAPGEIRPVDSLAYAKFEGIDYVKELTSIDNRVDKINNKINNFRARELAWLVIADVTKSTTLISDHKVDGILQDFKNICKWDGL